MKKSAYVRFSITLLVLFSLLSPTAALAGDGKKHFKEGMQAEAAEQWDKAAEEFALAITDSPKNTEYLLHYRRSLFMASQMYMRRGTSLANDKDYAGAYLAFRKSYAYDPTNELAKSETERMLRLQQGTEGGVDPAAEKKSDGTVKLVPTGYQKQSFQNPTIPQKLEVLSNYVWTVPTDLQTAVKELAKQLDLNVLFDKESNLDNRKVKIELRNVTAAKALDYIFLQENLFFQKVGPRTILVAIGNRRQNFQQLVLRTFYLSNADPKDVQKVIQGAIPPQPGRAPTVNIIDEDTNSITIRDTSENIRIISKLISSLDKDRAEVVMDVAIYEVSRTDLLQLGNQIGNSDSLQNLGGSTLGAIGNSNFGRIAATAGSAASIIPRAFGVGLVIPPVNLVAFQKKDNTKLLASTQIHAFNNEDSSARIGQRVPVQTAQLLGYGNGTGTGGTTNQFNPAASVVNYEQVGLTLKFKPIVFPNQDVQVAMEIESKDVVACGITSANDNPCFSERTIKGTARVQNNKTLLLASAAQDVESNGRQGLPLLGLIPILGRFFTAPTKNNRQVDIVIAVTPRVIRAPAILPEDEIERPTGSLAVPTSGSLEAMIVQEEIEENLAAARKIPNVAQVQMPDQPVVEAPTYTKSNATQTVAATEQKPNAGNILVSEKTDAAATPNNQAANMIANLRPIETTVKTLQIAPSLDLAENKVQTQQTSLKAAGEETKSVKEIEQPNAPLAQLQFLTALPEMKAGEKMKIAVMVKSATAFRSGVLGLQFDPKKMAIRSVSFGDVFGAGLAQTAAKPFMNQNGKMFVSLSSPKDIAENTSGILAYIEVEALADGKHDVAFDKDVLNLLTADGKNFVVKY